MIHIIGEGILKEARAFNDVRDSLAFDHDVYLGAMWAKVFGVELKDQVIYNMEYLYDDSPLWSIGYKDVLMNNIVLDYNKQNVEYLRTRIGVKAFHLPYGYHPSLERTKSAPTQDIDVLFVGSTYHSRRVQLLHDLESKVNLFVAQGYYGPALDALIPRAKVHLNMHHVDGQPLEVARINYLMANHCNIVSEIGNGYQEYFGGARFVEYDRLVDACLEALDSPIDGYEIVKQMPTNCKAANEWIGGVSCLQ